jgi:tellurite methyltransferase
MQRAMRGFHQDTEGHWAAELACGHAQHVRHQPPFTLRPWVATSEGRAGRIGQELECPLCDRKEMPAGHGPYKRTASFTRETVPQGLLQRHSTKAGVWALVHVSRGALEFFEAEAGGESRQLVRAGQTAVIRPELEHRVAPLEDVEFFVEFWRAGVPGVPTSAA